MISKMIILLSKFLKPHKVKNLKKSKRINLKSCLKKLKSFLVMRNKSSFYFWIKILLIRKIRLTDLKYQMNRTSKNYHLKFLSNNKNNKKSYKLLKINPKSKFNYLSLNKYPLTINQLYKSHKLKLRKEIKA